MLVYTRVAGRERELSLLGDEALGAVGEGEDKEIQTWEFT